MRKKASGFQEEGEVRRSLVSVTGALLLSLRFTGKVSVVMQNGRVLKSGYKEGYFSHRGTAGVD